MAAQQAAGAGEPRQTHRESQDPRTRLAAQRQETLGARMSHTEDWDWRRETPSMSMLDALELASRRSGRPAAEARNVTYVSATQLKAVLAEDPGAATALQRFGPHWRIQFALEEAFVGGRRGGYTFRLGRDDDVLVYEDGAAMTHYEVTGGA